MIRSIIDEKRETMLQCCNVAMHLLLNWGIYKFKFKICHTYMRIIKWERLATQLTIVRQYRRNLVSASDSHKYSQLF